MNFRKRYKISKSTHLNLSGGGIGLSWSIIPGLSYSFNSKGIYRNTSIPGTGFYSRKKVAGWNDFCKDTQEDSKPSTITLTLNIDVTADDDNVIHVKTTYSDTGEDVEEERMQQIRKQEVYKEALAETYVEFVQEFNDKTEELTDIYKLTASPMSEFVVRGILEELTPVFIEPQTYQEPEPEVEQIRAELQAEAERQINPVLFWTAKSKREAYIAEHLSERVAQAMHVWKTDKEAFDKQEAQRVKESNAQIQQQHDEEMSQLAYLLKDDGVSVSDKIDGFIEKLELPIDVELDYDYDEKSKSLYVDLLLPSIEIMPNRKAALLATGKPSVKSKTKYELNNDYMTCVVGVAFFIASALYNTTTSIDKMLVNGFSTRISGATGNMEETAIYSVVFNREQFSQINYQKINPVDALTAFPCHIDLLKTMEYKSIQPFTKDEI